MDLPSIRRNKLARDMARDLLDFADDLLCDCPLEFKDDDSLGQRFWELVRQAVDIRLELPGPPEDCPNGMSHEQARKFSEQEMPWGTYIGTKVNQVPLDYLLYITEDKSGFKRDLKRYLASKSVQAEMPDSED